MGLERQGGREAPGQKKEVYKMADLGYNESGIHDIRRQKKRLIMVATDVREQYAIRRSGENTVPEREPLAVRNNRKIYGQPAVYGAGGGDSGSIECGKGAEEEGKGSVYAELICRHMPIEDACRTEGRKALLAALIG